MCALWPLGYRLPSLVKYVSVSIAHLIVVLRCLTEHSQPSGLTPCAGMAYRGSSTYPGDEGRK